MPGGQGAALPTVSNRPSPQLGGRELVARAAAVVTGVAAHAKGARVGGRGEGVDDSARRSRRQYWKAFGYGPACPPEWPLFDWSEVSRHFRPGSPPSTPLGRHERPGGPTSAPPPPGAPTAGPSGPP